MAYALSLAISSAVERLCTLERPWGLENDVLIVLALNFAIVFILFKYTMMLLLCLSTLVAKVYLS